MDFIKKLGQYQWKSDKIGEQGIFQINRIADFSRYFLT